MTIDSYKFKLILAEKEMTQADLSRLCGISRQNISGVLSRRRCLPITAGKLAKALGVKVEEFATDETEVV